jgi:hypothetical protein
MPPPRRQVQRIALLEMGGDCASGGRDSRILDPRDLVACLVEDRGEARGRAGECCWGVEWFWELAGSTGIVALAGRGT